MSDVDPPSALAGVGAALSRTKAGAAYEEIRKRIIDGSLEPGTVLDQESLSAALQLSTTPVREALRRLEMEHLVEISAHREVRVPRLTLDEIRDIFAVRLRLDPLAAALATVRAPQSAIDAAVGFAQERPAGPAHRLDLNRTLHRTIYSHCGNQVLIEILDSLWDRSERYRTFLYRSSEHDSGESHLRIGRAFQLRDAQLVSKIVEDHLIENMNHLEQLSDQLIDDHVPAEASTR